MDQKDFKNAALNNELYKSLTFEPEVTLFAYTQENNVFVEDPSVYGALACFNEKSSLDLLEEDILELSQEEYETKLDRMFDETSGRGHGSVLDQNRFIFVLKDVPRVTTLQICQPQYGEHLQQSLRRANASPNYYLSESIIESSLANETIGMMKKAFYYYDKFIELGVPKQDARIVLPLGTRTNIQSSFNVREFLHIQDMSKRKGVSSITTETINKMYAKMSEVAPHMMKERPNSKEVLAWYPSMQLFSPENVAIDRLIESKNWSSATLIDSSEKTLSYSKDLVDIVIKGIENRDESVLSMLKHNHYTFMAKMSLMSLHQAMRQRTWDQCVESIYHAADRGSFIEPPTIENSLKNGMAMDDYDELMDEMLGLYHRLINSGVPAAEAILVLPHSLEVHDLIHINGWNAIHAIGKRTCTEAQWEIREVATNMAKELRKRNEYLKRFAQPQGVVYGHCPEKKSCGYCEMFLEKQKNDINNE